MGTARWFFRVLEGDDGRWACKRGRHVIDTHNHVGDALRHVARMAAANPPSEVFLHRLDGSLTTIELLDLTSQPEKTALSRSH